MLLIIKLNVDIVHNIIHVHKNRRKTENHLWKSSFATYRHYTGYTFIYDNDNTNTRRVHVH